MVANLCGVLLRFRMKKIAMVADIKKAYLQLELNPIDRDVNHFLWVKDITLPYSEGTRKRAGAYGGGGGVKKVLNLGACTFWMVPYRFCKMIWGIICSAFLLASTIMFHLEKHNNSIAQDISRNFYVDNLNDNVHGFFKKVICCRCLSENIK